MTLMIADTWKAMYYYRYSPYVFILCSSQEFGCILDQMLSVASSLGWDTSELRPVRL